MAPMRVSCPGSPESPASTDHGTTKSSSPPPAGRKLPIALGPGGRIGSTFGQADGGCNPGPGGGGPGGGGPGGGGPEWGTSSGPGGGWSGPRLPVPGGA